jgi:predicted ATPase
VIESLRAAFPDFFEDFEFYGDAQTVRAKVYLKGIPEAMPVSFIPDGLLVAMLHLAAVGGSPSRAFVAIDDFENYLHPFAIRSLIESIRGFAAQRDLCVLIATHSPVVLDEYRTEPDRVFVMDIEPHDKPIQLNHLRDAEWLSHFSLGDLYSKLEFGARLPRAEASDTSDTTMRNGR